MNVLRHPAQAASPFRPLRTGQGRSQGKRSKRILAAHSRQHAWLLKCHEPEELRERPVSHTGRRNGRCSLRHLSRTIAASERRVRGIPRGEPGSVCARGADTRSRHHQERARAGLALPPGHTVTLPNRALQQWGYSFARPGQYRVNMSYGHVDSNIITFRVK
jgi:hypothetical protein